MTDKLIVYSKTNCPGCVTLKNKLKAEGKEFVEVVLGQDMSIEAFKERFPEVRSVPHTEVIYESKW